MDAGTIGILLAALVVAGGMIYTTFDILKIGND